MQPPDDIALLRQYAADQSDDAFGLLAARHVNLVYSVALRQVGNSHNAEEVTQAVFVILSRKAGQFRSDRGLSSWLFQTTRLTATNFVRSEIRRQHREQEAHMQSVLNESDGEAWFKIASLLDSAVAGLREKDRHAILLRFYEGRNYRDIGLVLGASEDAAEKRVNRTLERLRRFFAKRGMVSSSAAIAEAMSVNAVRAAPAGLAAAVSAAVVKGPAVAASTLALVQGTLKLMAWIKAKTVIAVGAGALLAGAAMLTLHEREEQNRRQEQAIRAEEQQIRAQEDQLRTEEQRADLTPEQRRRLADNLTRLRTRQDELRATQNRLRVAQDQLREQDPNPFAHPSMQISPFTAVRVENGRVIVTYLGSEYDLAAANGVSVADMLAFCSQEYGADKVEKRIVEDILVVLSNMGHPVGPDQTVSLTLVDLKTGEKTMVEHAAMTGENRRAIMEARLGQASKRLAARGSAWRMLLPFQWVEPSTFLRLSSIRYLAWPDGFFAGPRCPDSGSGSSILVRLTTE